MVIAVMAPLFLVVTANIVLTLARRPITARLTSDPEEWPKVAASLAATSFHVAIVAMSLVFTAMLMIQVLSADPSRVTNVGPVVVLAVFAGFYAQPRYLPEKMAGQARRGWRIGAVRGESVEIYAELFRARSRILALGLIGPVLVLLARVFFFGALGDVEQMPAGMLLDRALLLVLTGSLLLPGPFVHPDPPLEPLEHRAPDEDRDGRQHEPDREHPAEDPDHPQSQAHHGRPGAHPEHDASHDEPSGVGSSSGSSSGSPSIINESVSAASVHSRVTTKLATDRCASV